MKSTVATPAISPAAATYNGPVSVGIGDATVGATIHYTMDGSTPTASSPTYTGPFTVSVTTTVSAIALAAGYDASAVASTKFVVTPPTATPTISPIGGTYSTQTQVTITDATPGAAVYYTTDGSVPTVSSPRYTAPFTVAGTTTVSAVALAPGDSLSGLASSSYVVTPPAAAPVITPGTGTYTSAQTVNITDATPSPTIYYTLDGSVPTKASLVFTGSLKVTATQTISAIATAPGYSASPSTQVTVTIAPPAAPPTFNPAAGTYSAAQTVSIADTTAGAVIFYTTDGTTPSHASNKYSAPISIDSTKTVQAIAAAPNFSDSANASATYTIHLPASTPVFSVPGGTFTSAQTVSITSATPGATIYYTVDGSTPTTSSRQYSVPLQVASSETIEAIATAPDLSPSAVAAASYTIEPPAAPPVLSPAGGIFTQAQTVSISSTTAAAVIYYTVDGSIPTDRSSKYTAPIAISGSETIRAVAIASGFSFSGVASGDYTVLQSAVSGTVKAGTAAVSGATVQIFAAGNTGYRSASTGLDPLPAVTDSHGKFTVNFNCPSASSQVYLVATQGNPGLAAGTKNSALALMAGLGSCGRLTGTNNVTVNEATTVAAAAALAPFMSSAFNAGTSGTNAAGLANAFATISSIVDAATGTTLATTPSGVGVNPQATMNSLANLLATCTTSDGTGTACMQLFLNATPVGGTKPADTLQAALDIAQHPGDNVIGLYGILPTSGSSGPYQPSLTSAPADWTLGIAFAYQTVSQGSTNTPYPSANGIAIDAAGNAWIADLYVHGLIEIQPDGSLPASGQNGYPGDDSPSISAGAAIDAQGNIWYGGIDSNGVGALYVYDPAQGKQVSPSGGYVATPLQYPGTIAFDGSNNAWVIDSGQVLKFKGDGTPVTDTAGFTAGGISTPLSLAFDSQGNAWIGDQSAGLVKLSNSGTTGIAYSIGVQYPNAIALDSSANVWLGDGAGSGGIAEASPMGRLLSPPNTEFTGGGLATPNLVAIDGAGDVWAANSGGGSVVTLSELDREGKAITPATGYNPPQGAFNSYGGMALDASGNVWLLNGVGPTPGPIKMIGLATPVVTPLGASLVAPHHPADPAIERDGNLPAQD